jgi:hypothetical protein
MFDIPRENHGHFFGAGVCYRLWTSAAAKIGNNVPVPRRRGSTFRCNRLSGVIVPLAPEYNMGGFLRRNELNAFVSLSAHVNPLEQSLSHAQQDRRDSDVQLIDEPRTKILPDSVSSAANAHIHSVGCVARPVERLVNTARDEVECRSAFHLYGRARVMSQDESWNVIRWVVPPPAFPVHVGPGTANRSEHVSSENPGANILEAPRSEVVIDPRCATVGAK